MKIVVTGSAFVDIKNNVAHRQDPHDDQFTRCGKATNGLIFTKIAGVSPCTVCFKDKLRSIQINK